MTTESDPAPKTVEERKASAFATWAKGAAPLITAIGGVILGLVGIFRKETVAEKLYTSLSHDVEKVSAATVQNHDDFVSLRSYLAGAGVVKDVSPVLALPVDAGAPASSASAMAVLRPLPLIPRTGVGGGVKSPLIAPSILFGVAPPTAASVAIVDKSMPIGRELFVSADAGALVALVPLDQSKLPKLSPRPVQYSAKPVAEVP
jgi:hypothetical protein